MLMERHTGLKGGTVSSAEFGGQRNGNVLAAGDRPRTGQLMERHTGLGHSQLCGRIGSAQGDSYHHSERVQSSPAQSCVWAG